MTTENVNQVAPVNSNGNAIVSFQDLWKADVEKTIANERGLNNSIRFQQAQIYVGEARVGNSMSVYVLDSIHLNTYYSGAYDPKVVAPPDCYAFFRGAEASTASPIEGCENPQSDMCTGCPQNEYGTARNGRPGKACSNTRRIAVLPATKVGPAGTPVYLSAEELASTPILYGKLPVTSCKGFSKYAQTLANAPYERPLWSVVSLLKTEPHPQFQFVVEFTCLAMPDVSNNADVLQVLATKKEEASRGITFRFVKMENNTAARPQVVENGKF